MATRDIIELSILSIGIIAFIIWILITIHSIKVQNRINKHTIANNTKEISIFDKLLNKYNLFKKRLSNKIYKQSTIKDIKLTKKQNDFSTTIDSIVSALVFIFTYIILSLIYNNKIYIFTLILITILGFILPGIINIIKEKIKKEKIEKSILKVISIINNNLQANKSIKEALIDTKNKVDNPIKEELNEVIYDLDHGLSLETAFKRMQDRCNIDEITYLTTSLSILSKTGGNNKEVFNYLEDLFKTRKKLNQELDATIASSKLVYIILSILPIIVFGGMILIYDNYLDLYLSTEIGKILGMCEILLYLSYLIIIKKIMIIEKY